MPTTNYKECKRCPTCKSAMVDKQLLGFTYDGCTCRKCGQKWLIRRVIPREGETEFEIELVAPDTIFKEI